MEKGVRKDEFQVISCEAASEGIGPGTKWVILGVLY